MYEESYSERDQFSSLTLCLENSAEVARNFFAEALVKVTVFLCNVKSEKVLEFVFQKSLRAFNYSDLKCRYESISLDPLTFVVQVSK
jgi:hypothetical protein